VRDGCVMEESGFSEEVGGDAVAWARSAEDAALRACDPVRIRGSGGLVGVHQFLPNDDKP
jgi:hypothetical protein